MRYTTFHKEISAGKIRPAYLLTGKEDYLAEIGVNLVVDKILTPSDREFNLSVFYGSDPKGLVDAMNSPPIFAEKRVTVIRHAHELPGKYVDAVVRYLSSPPSDACLLLSAGDADRRRSFFKKVSGSVEIVECSKLSVRDQEKWIKAYISRNGKKINGGAINRLMSISWYSMRDLAGELDRLILLVGDTPSISVQDVEEMGGGSYLFERWRLTEAVGSGDAVKSLDVAKNLQYWNIKPLQIIGDLYRMFLKMWLLNWYIRKNKVSEAKGNIGLHPFVLTRYTQFARRLGEKGIADGILRILEADLNIKRGLRRPELEIDMLVSDLVNITGA